MTQELSQYRLLLPYLQQQWPTISRGFLGIIGYVFATLTLIHLAGKLALPFGEGNVVAIAQLTGVCALVFLIRGFFQSIQDLYMSKAESHDHPLKV